jgi:hypothetical protein
MTATTRRYQAEAETLEGEMIVITLDTLKQAKTLARSLSKRHITAYAVVLIGGKAVGHVAYGEGRQYEILGDVA